MWIIRFHILETKDYNKIQRIYKKYGFSPRSISGIVFSKACILHHTQKSSWRSLGRQFGTDHAALYRFNEFAMKSGMLQEIFHVFLETRIALYIGDIKTINIADIHNSQEIYHLTKSEFESIFEGL